MARNIEIKARIDSIDAGVRAYGFEGGALVSRAKSREACGYPTQTRGVGYPPRLAIGERCGGPGIDGCLLLFPPNIVSSMGVIEQTLQW